MRVFKNGHLQKIGSYDSDEERGSFTRPFGASGEVVEAVPTLVGLS